MLKNIAVSGMTLTISPNTVTGTILVVTPPSTRVTAGGSAVYQGPVNITVTNVTQGTYVSPTASGTLQPTAIKGRAEGQYLLREGDQATSLSTTGTDPGNGSTTTITFDVEVSNAGQSKDRSE